jgi:hypothetical protein
MIDVYRASSSMSVCVCVCFVKKMYCLKHNTQTERPAKEFLKLLAHVGGSDKSRLLLTEV